MAESFVDQDCQKYDVVIVGAGPAGLMLSTCLARCGYKIKHIDNRPEPTKTGRADGIQPRSLELLRNLGLKADLMAHKPARVYEVAFWNPLPSSQGIGRTGTWASCPDFIDAAYPFSALLHQGHIERVFIRDLGRRGVVIQRPWTIQSFHLDEEGNPDYPVQVDLTNLESVESETVRSKYLFSGEGSKSSIRQKLNIGLQRRDPIEHVWGVLDGVVETDFPDIKGSILIVPREDDMIRLYVQIASSTDADWDPRKTATAHETQQIAKRILRPFNISWQRVEWCSVYPIGQSIADRYTRNERIFLGGDACHTHSPKAGQGMNTAFIDALNLAWKIHVVEAGLAERGLLRTYESERRAVAESKGGGTAADAACSPGAEGQSDDEFMKTFKYSCKFTGYDVSYGANIVNWSPSHQARSPLMFPRGTKLASGSVCPRMVIMRVVDANVVDLAQEFPLIGSFRIYIFAGNAKSTARALSDFAHALNKETSFLMAYQRGDVETVSHLEMDNPHSRFFTFCVLFAGRRAPIEISRDVPGILARYRKHVYTDDARSRHMPDEGSVAHAKVGAGSDRGGIVVVRPDGHVAAVVALVEGTGSVDALNEYFGAFCTKPPGHTVPRL